MQFAAEGHTWPHTKIGSYSSHQNDNSTYHTVFELQLKMASMSMIIY